MAAMGLPRSMEANAAVKVASSGRGFVTWESTMGTSRLTACAVVITSIVKLLVADNRPSLTTNWIACVPTGSTVVAVSPVARIFPASYQVKFNTSPSGSDEREPSRTISADMLSRDKTTGFASIREMAKSGETVATAFGEVFGTEFDQ